MARTCVSKATIGARSARAPQPCLGVSLVAGKSYRDYNVGVDRQFQPGIWRTLTSPFLKGTWYGTKRCSKDPDGIRTTLAGHRLLARRGLYRGPNLQCGVVSLGAARVLA